MLISARTAGQRDATRARSWQRPMGADHHADETAHSARSSRSERAHPPYRAPLPAVRRLLALRVCARRRWSRGRAPTAAPLRLRERPRLRAAEGWRSSPTPSRRSSSRPSCTGSTPPSWPRPSRARPATDAEADAAHASVDQRSGQLDELAAHTGSSQITFPEWLAARKPIEARIEAGKRKLSRLTRTTAHRPLTRRRARPSGALGGPDAEPSARDRRRGARSSRCRARPSAAGHLRPRPGRARLARSDRGAPRSCRSPARSSTLAGRPCAARSVRPTRADLGTDAAHAHDAHTAGGPSQASSSRRPPDPLGRRAHVRLGPADDLVGRRPVDRHPLAAGSLGRPRTGGARQLTARRPRSLPTYFDRYRAARRASPSAPDPTGRSPSSLMCTKPWPHACRCQPYASSGRPRSGRAGRGRPDATPAPTGTGTVRRPSSRRRKNPPRRPGAPPDHGSPPRLRQRPEPVEPVRGAVPADLARPSRRIGRAPPGSMAGRRRPPARAAVDRNEPPPSAASGYRTKSSGPSRAASFVPYSSEDPRVWWPSWRSRRMLTTRQSGGVHRPSRDATKVEDSLLLRKSI